MSSLIPLAWQRQHQEAQAQQGLALRPFVTLKAAITLDGKVANANGDSKWITAQGTRQHAHMLRAEHDAILVGVNTALVDDPQLNVRLQTQTLARTTPPARIVLDSQAQTPPNARCWQEDGALRMMVCTHTAPPYRVKALRTKGVVVLQHPPPRPNLTRMLHRLQQRWGIQTVLVEGGAALHASFIAERLADALVLYMAGKIMGQSTAPAWCADLPTTPRHASGNMQMLAKVTQLQAFTLQEDIWLLGRF